MEQDRINKAVQKLATEKNRDIENFRSRTEKERDELKNTQKDLEDVIANLLEKYVSCSRVC